METVLINGKKYTFISDFKDNELYRKSFNELTEKTFGFNFVRWYDNGYWGEKYIPYSLADGDRIAANVSVNLMDFDMDGIEKHYIQIGTVMTDEGYQGQGLGRYLMEKVINEYTGKVDGIYLFANAAAVNFYLRFGFVKCTEYQYSKNICPLNNAKKIEPVDMSDKVNWKGLFDTVKAGVSNGRFTMNNAGLIAFWTTGPMSGSVYYLADKDAYVIAEVGEEKLVIHQIIAGHKVSLQEVIDSFGCDIKKVSLGFTPNDMSGYVIEELHEEDCTLLILGEDLRNIEKKRLMFPTLSHA